MFYDADALMQKGIAEQAVCLMDIPDDWNRQYNIELYRDTFDTAISFAKKYPDTRWCYGNHDLSYIWGESEPGYSVAAAWIVRKKLEELKNALPSENQLQYIHLIGNVAFCHGGISDAFARKVLSTEQYDDINTAIAEINTLPKLWMWDDASPLWYRPQYAKGKMYAPEKLLQVTGHTPVDRIYREESIIFCDVFSTYADGRTIGTQEYLLVDTVTWTFSGVKL